MTLEPGHYCYYHTLGTIFKVLENGTIRARNIAYLNDSDEYWFGLRVLRTQLDVQLKESADTLADEIRTLATRCRNKLEARNTADPLYYPVCLTTNVPWEEYGLPHWVMYGHDAGVALELDLSGTKGAFWVDTDRPGNDKYHRLDPLKDQATAYTPIAVTYLHPDVVDSSCANRPPVTEDTMSEDAYALSVKRLAFEQEKEHRLVFDASENTVAESVKFFETDDGLLSPYLDIHFGVEPTGNALSTDELKSPGWPIISVTVGPATNPYQQDREYSNLKALLDGPTLKVAALSLEQRHTQISLCLSSWQARVEQHIRSLDMSNKTLSAVLDEVRELFTGASKDIEEFREKSHEFLQKAKENSESGLRVIYGNQTKQVLDTLISSLVKSSSKWSGHRGDIRELCVEHCTVLPRYGILLRRVDSSFRP